MKIDLSGCIMGSLYVIKDVSTNNNKRYLCRCIETRFKIVVNQSDLLNGRVRSLPKKYHHGLSKSPEYSVWEAMIQRCTNKNDKKYKLYGARGIGVCNRWLSFVYFYYDMGKRPTKNHTLERLDSNSSYSPSNCIWATYRQQNRNTSRNVYIDWYGKKRIIVEIAETENISNKMLRYHLSKNRDPVDIVNYLKNKKGRQTWESFFAE